MNDDDAPPEVPPPASAGRDARVLYGRASRSPALALAERPTPQFGSSARLDEFLRTTDLPTPFVVVDLDIVAEQYMRLQQALPQSDIFYAAKANPGDEILQRLNELGCHFDVASPGEIDSCLLAGARPDALSFGNTIKKERDIAYAHDRGVDLFAFDSASELDKISRVAPGSTVFCRILTSCEGADWPLSRKFGCEPEMAFDLLVDAASRGLGTGVSFHVGSQQRDPDQWDRPISEAAAVLHGLADRGIEPKVLNLGGGFPASYYSDRVPSTAVYGQAIDVALERHLGSMVRDLRVIAEPGRYLVGDAGVLQSEVVLVSRKSSVDERRWVYLDVGIFHGLAESMGEAIRYRLRTPHDGRPCGPVVLAGPTCDSVDILYDKADYHLPLDLAAGDRVEVLSAGAYTTTYSTVGFNGFPPLQQYCI